MGAPLLPIAPILLLPFLIVAAIIGLPLYIAALLVLGVLRLLVWPLERLVVALGSGSEMTESRRLAAAFRWVLTVGGVTSKFAGASVGSGGVVSAAGQRDGRGNGSPPRA